MGSRDEAERVQPADVAQWREWLTEHHATSSGAWLVTWKRHTGRPTIGYEDAVLEALAVGWIDSQAQTLDEDRSMLWFCPRRTASGWSRPNKRRVELLLSEGRMQPAGQAALDAAHANGAWSLLDDVEDLVVPDDLAAALDRRPGSRQTWDGLSRSVRRAALEQLVHAKRPATRAARVDRIAERTVSGERPL